MNLNASPVARLRREALAISILGHLTLGLAVGYLLVKRTSHPTTVPFEVLSYPKVAPLPIYKPANDAVLKRSQAKSRPVFGLSKKGVTTGAGSVEVKPGNTIAKVSDTATLRPGDAESLPIPTEDFLVTSMPELLEDFRIGYPTEAKRGGVQGPVLLELLINTDGAVADATVIEGPGLGLNEAACEAAKKMKFRPAHVDDKPVAVRIRYVYRFILEK